MSEHRNVEAEGATVEEAVQVGLGMLQVARSNVIVEILEDPEDDLGAERALVRLTTSAPPMSPQAQPAAVSSSSTPHEVTIPTARPATPDEISPGIQAGRDTLQQLLAHMGMEVEIQVEHAAIVDEEEGEDPLLLQIKGEDGGMLIGHKGEILAALQYVLRLMVSHERHERLDLVVDAMDYKTKRAAKLYALAHRMADQAVQRRRTLHLEPMPPHERRVIHMALRERDDVKTESVGEGRTRKVTIVPANSSKPPQRRY
jgi:spoIIIJ-associated protein